MRPYLPIVAVLAAAFLSAPIISCAAQSPAPTVSVAPDPLPLTLPVPKAGRARPLVAVVADNAGSETTDFTIPYGVLKDSGAAAVVSVSTRPGPVKLMMTLTIEADETLAAFDSANPAGADIVIVPAMMNGKDPALLAWLRTQYERGAVIVSICEGARVTARAGLLHGHAATTHWSAMKDLAKHYPDTAWIRDRRYLQSGRMISTTGVTASIPLSLALIEAIAGRPTAQAEADRLGVSGWGPEHSTAAFQPRASDFTGNILGIAAVWNHPRMEAPIADGVDEIALALTTDAWGRIFRGKVVTTAQDGRPVVSRHGLRVLPEARPRAGGRVLAIPAGPSALALDAALAGIGSRFGPTARRLSALGLEYGAP
jgi:putative intracellular protease/amidase